MSIGCNNKSSTNKRVKFKDSIDSIIKEYLKLDSIYYVDIKRDLSKKRVDEFTDSITVVYRQKVHGYSVKAVLKINDGAESTVLSADIYFSKNKHLFCLHSTCFGDTLFCKGRLETDNNFKIYKENRHKTITVDYKEDVENCPLQLWSPFFFKDLDFDGKDELGIVHNSMAVRYHNGYDVYRIVENTPFLINYPPYNQDRSYWGFGMTDYPQFDFKRKIITCPYPEGELTREGCKIYGLSKRKKDIIRVNGHKYYFNHITLIKAEVLE